METCGFKKYNYRLIFFFFWKGHFGCTILLLREPRGAQSLEETLVVSLTHESGRAGALAKHPKNP